ncbi:MAG TPA: helix-turn-helix transcriptional regulator [Ktedonobacteraceae bacterium]|nr:helix-turn-helix transcriptional regulator [Ktedonobacteraceae bacterium]
MERLRGEEQKAAGKHARYGTNLKLKQAREHRGWAQADVANKIGAQTNLVTRWERGNAFPSPYYRQKLCGLFEATIEELGLVKEEIRDAPKDLSPGDVLPGAVRNAFQAEKAFPSQLAEKDGLFSRRHLVLGLAGAHGIRNE